jgi:hypothetical protein
VAEGGCFGVSNGSPIWEKRSEVFLGETGSKSWQGKSVKANLEKLRSEARLVFVSS